MAVPGLDPGFDPGIDQVKPGPERSPTDRLRPFAAVQIRTDERRECARSGRWPPRGHSHATAKRTSGSGSEVPSVFQASKVPSSAIFALRAWASWTHCCRIREIDTARRLSRGTSEYLVSSCNSDSERTSRDISVSVSL